MFKAYRGQMKGWTDAAQRACVARGIDVNKTWWTRMFLFAAATGEFKVNFTDEQVTRGRGERDEEMEPYQFKATDTELRLWGEAARAQGLNRSEWCRQVLDAAARVPEDKMPRVSPGVWSN